VLRRREAKYVSIHFDNSCNNVCCLFNFQMLQHTSGETRTAENDTGTRQRKTGLNKAYPTKVKHAVERSDILRCSHRGVVSLASESDKPSISTEELLENR